MSQDTNNTTFRHVVLKGTAAQVGAAQAKAIAHIPAFVNWLRSGNSIPNRPSFQRTEQLMARFSPAAAEEIHAFCETLEIAPADVYYYAATHLAARYCSHMIALPSITENGHVLVGRNYDFGDRMDDLRLVTTAIQGQYTHIGFSTLFFGRQDGMNEKGLSVTMSVGGMPVSVQPGFRPPIQDGLSFWALGRTLLEHCASVDEAVALISEFPSCDNPIFLVADASGAAVRAEIFGAEKHFTRIDASTPSQYLIATNHFQSAQTRALEPMSMIHSTTRHRAAQQWFDQYSPKINGSAFKELLAAPYPNGLCCHYYDQMFGCLHSMVFDLNQRTVDVSFGSPAVNPWVHFDLSGSQPGEFQAYLPREQWPVDFWQVDPNPQIEQI
jgi:predicted choloylglycine hydrolase